jgi:hypothetical protein
MTLLYARLNKDVIASREAAWRSSATFTGLLRRLPHPSNDAPVRVMNKDVIASREAAWQSSVKSHWIAWSATASSQ